MPYLVVTAGFTGGPGKHDHTGSHTDSAAAFVPDQSRAERPTSFDVGAFPIPNGREEEWRFTPVDRLGICTQCGFGTMARRGQASLDLVERKLSRIAETAREVWGST